ncbi:MAG TPA: hypothetical protein VJ806_14185 [Luteimonas sp.]|nr:hypothetical protein [Luteimonas sp.]
MEGSQWYRDSRGDYLICHNPVREYQYGGVYETFDAEPGGEYVRDQFVCTEGR